MKKNNKKIDAKNEVIKQTSDESDQIKTFVYILLGVALITVLLYFLSSKVLIKDGVDKKEESGEVSIAYNNVNVGNVFNRPDDEYYVFAFDPTTTKANYYYALMSNFDTEKTNMYYLDLAVEINKNYIKEESNKNATKASELALKEPTLMLIKKGKIAKYLESEEEIVKELE